MPETSHRVDSRPPGRLSLSHGSDREALLESFDRGWCAAIEWMSNPMFGTHTMAAIDRRLIEIREARVHAADRMRRLDEAERLGADAYDAERARQGLIPYQRATPTQHTRDGSAA